MTDIEIRMRAYLAENAAESGADVLIEEAAGFIAAQRRPRMLLVESDRAVCIGGKWDGWLFWLHPNGNWVSARKLRETEPTIDPVFSSGGVSLPQAHGKADL